MTEAILKQFKQNLQQTFRNKIENLQKLVEDRINSFQIGVELLVETKISKLEKIQSHLKEDYEENLLKLFQQFDQGIVEIANEIDTSICKTIESNTLSQSFSSCLKEVDNNKKQFDVYAFKLYNNVQPESIQPRDQSISQIHVLNKCLTALVYQSNQQIVIIDHVKQRIVNSLQTPFIRNIISSNPSALSLCFQTDREIVTINYHTLKMIRSFTVNNYIDEMICVCQLSQSLFAYATNFGRIWIVDITTGQIITKLDGEIPSLLLKFNNKYLIAAGISRGIFVWDWRKNITVQRFIGHNSRINSVIKYDSDNIISCDQSGKIYMFQLSTSVRHKQFIGHEKPVIRVIKLNDDYIASCSYDKTIRFWNVQSELCFRKLDRHDNFVLDVAKLGKNKLISTCLDKILIIWG